jgi:hypothetical protein
VGVKSGCVPRWTGSAALQCGKPAEAGYATSFQHLCLTWPRLNRTLSRAKRCVDRIEGRGSPEKVGAVARFYPWTSSGPCSRCAVVVFDRPMRSAHPT